MIRCSQTAHQSQNPSLSGFYMILSPILAVEYAFDCLAVEYAKRLRINARTALQKRRTLVGPHVVDGHEGHLPAAISWRSFQGK